MTELISLIAGGYGSDLPQASGASLDIIQQLEAEIGAQLPTDYREYLHLLGENNGGLDLFADCVSSASKLLGFYRRVKADPFPENDLPADFAIVGIYGDAMSQVFLGLNGDRCNQLWSGESRTPIRCFADDFSRAVYRSGFNLAKGAVNNRQTHQHTLVSSHPIDSTADTYARLRELGFTAERFSDEYGFCATRSNGSAVSTKWYSKSHLSVYIFGPSESVRDVISMLIAHGFLLSKWPQSPRLQGPRVLNRW